VGVIEHSDGHRWWQFEIFSRVPELSHCFSLASKDGSGNISLSGNRDQQLAIHERAYWCNSIGANPDDLVVGGQVHGNSIHVVEQADGGRGAQSPQTVIKNTDGLFTSVVDLPLLSAVGDCAALLIYSPGRLALIHAGWRGMAGQIIPKAINLFCAQGVSVAHIKVGISPCISQASFQVGADVAEHVPASCKELWPQQDNKWAVNLAAWGQVQFLNCGLLSNNIEIAEIDTKSDQRCFSHRRQGELAGRMGLFAKLNMT